MTTWRVGAATDVGRRRDLNEDAFIVSERLALVCDGMGGHAAGEIASALAADLISLDFIALPTVTGLETAFVSANRAVLADAAMNPSRAGMGTTATAIGLVDDGETTAPVIVHVGDSRAYQIRDGAVKLLTLDHTVAEEFVRMGRLTPAEAETDPRRHQLTRCIGAEKSLLVDVLTPEVQPGDRVLLCSDGLSNEVSEKQIAEIVSNSDDLERIAVDLVAAANHNGGRDNITAVVIEFDDVTPLRQPVERVGDQRVVASRPASPPRRRRTLWWRSWRTWAAIGVLIGVLGIGVAILRWWTYSTYYLGNSQGIVAVYQGQPGGVLWFQPHIVAPTQYPSAQLRPADLTKLNATIPVASVNAGFHVAAYMNTQWRLSTVNSGR